MLCIENLTIQRGTTQNSHRVVLPQLQLQRGEILAITGASGCGKSTLLESIGLLLKPKQLDHYELEHTSLHHWDQLTDAATAKLRAEKIGFILQSGGLIPYLTVQDNIYLPRKILGKSGSTPAMKHAIEHLNVATLLHKMPAMLSIGERQRVAFIRAISHEPSLLLADEPTAALDPLHAQRLFALFQELVSQSNMCALVVSHDWDLVQQFGIPRLQGKMSPGVCRFV